LEYILCIETSTTNCSVSLSKKGETLVLKEDYNNNYSHAERLHLFIEEVINEAKITTKDLSAIAISKGPGSYTGLRIGVSAAKGLCFALEIPLISVSTLEALADQIKINEGIIITMLDARRMEVYSAVFDKHNNQIRETKAQVLDENSFKSYLNEGKVYFVGNGVQKSKEVITHENAFFIENKLPSSENMSKIAYDKYKKSDIEDVAYFEPFYLKDFIALKPKS
jgi:tRNA threonylcarbamoyladenosine biosynthesis protein TsaB